MRTRSNKVAAVEDSEQAERIKKNKSRTQKFPECSLVNYRTLEKVQMVTPVWVVLNVEHL